MTKTIVTHTAPDFDAIASAWQLIAFAPGFEDARIQFMPLNAIDRPALAAADAVVDMGGEFDPDRLRFDHHHLEGSKSTATCAATQVYSHLNQGQDLYHLLPLIKEIHRGDLAQTPPVGIHSQLFGYKAKASELSHILSDYEIYSYGREILETVAYWLKKKAADQTELEKCVIWKSDDNMIWAIQGGGVGISFAAYEEGARVVVFEGKPITLNQIGQATYPVGATRAPEWTEPDLGALAAEIIQGSGDPHLTNELGRWYRHSAGFFAGRGTPKAPDSQPLQIDIKEIARAIHMVWDR